MCWRSNLPAGRRRSGSPRRPWPSSASSCRSRSSPPLSSLTARAASSPPIAARHKRRFTDDPNLAEMTALPMNDTQNVPRPIPLVDLRAQGRDLEAEIRRAVAEVFRRCDFILGAEVSLFERAFAEYCQVPHALGVGSGSDALQLACRALGLGAGDEVIVPAMTFAATAFAVSLCGARPVPVDVRPDDALIDPGKIEAAITPRTKAIIPVHLYGQCAVYGCSVRHRGTVCVGGDRGRGPGARRPLSRQARRQPRRYRLLQLLSGQEPRRFRRRRGGDDGAARSRRADRDAAQLRRARKSIGIERSASTAASIRCRRPSSG